MLVPAQFEEKEFEHAATGELQNGGYVRAAGQVIESILGYDVAGAPGPDHLIWQLLQVPRPEGVLLVPRTWQIPRPEAQRLPFFPVSLILQYKRPTYVDTRRAAQWGYWDRPYFRFAKDRKTQSNRLLRLQHALRKRAIVRYCAPAFWQTWELEAAITTRQTLTRSGFVRPSQLVGHRYWTYVQPGVNGYANPGRQTSAFETLRDLGEIMADPRRSGFPARSNEPRELFADHIVSIGRACARLEPLLRRRVDEWLEAVRRRQLQMSDRVVDLIGHAVMTSSMIGAADADWLLTDATAGLEL